MVNRELEAMGHDRIYKNLLGITLGTGFGAGVVIDNSILMYINPTLQFLVGLLYFGEALQVDQLIAFVIIWAGISVTMVEKGRRIRRERAAWKEGASGG